VVVVVAAGNTGYGSLTALARQTDVGPTMTINDPGNAALAITVGATHRDMPHTYGVSYFSSKGPTGDGRLKPDLVAPGERITSAAAGKALASAFPGAQAPAPGRTAVYIEDSGTSMAASHVSGAVANFLSIRREFIGRPHWEIGFDERGTADQGEVAALLAELPAQDLTDLLVFAHGWNSDRRLYRLYFQQVPGLLAQAGSQGRVGTLGVVWPSKRWADEPEPTGEPAGGGAAGLGDAPPADAALVEDLKDVFEGSAQRRALDELARLLAERPEDPAALARFQTLMGELAATPDAAPAGEDQGELALLEDAPEEVFGRFADAVPQTGEGGAADLGDAFGRLWNGAKEALRQLTYFEMKKRAGVIGKRGLARCWAASPRPTPRSASTCSGTASGPGWSPSPWPACPAKSLYLLQGAFSHFAFADALPMDRSRGGALKGMAARVDGPWWPRSRSTTRPWAGSTRWPR
jgi:Subtilase family